VAARPLSDSLYLTALVRALPWSPSTLSWSGIEFGVGGTVAIKYGTLTVAL
jgi:hypothetical protein